MRCPLMTCRFLFMAVAALLMTANAAAQRPSGGGPPGGGGRGERPAIGVVYGEVEDLQSGAPIEFATISILAFEEDKVITGGVTDAKGRFRITEIPLGRFRAQIGFMGYTSTTVEDIRLNPRGGIEQDLGTLRLEPNVQALEAAEIVEQRSTLEMMIDRKVFRVGDDLNSAGANATELLRNVPSVDVDIDGNLSLRGSGNVTILIDGRPSGLVGSATQSLLEQIPASSIDRVEIITSPTAKYDPEGVAGILNIILKKDKLEGKHGQVSVTWGSDENHSGSVNGNVRGQKLNFSFNAGWNQRNNYRSGDSERQQAFGGTLAGAYDSLSVLTSNSLADSESQSWNVRAGLDWTPTPKTTWNVGIRTNQGQNASTEDVVNLETWSTDALGGFTRYGLSSRDNASTDLDVGYEHKYGERHTLQAFARWSQREGISHDSLWQDLPSPALDTAYLANANLNDGGNWNTTVQVDYEKPLDHDGKLELGYKTILRESNEDQRFWQRDSARIPFEQAYDFRYREDIHAAYATWGRKYGAWGVQVGGRGEVVYTTAELQGDSADIAAAVEQLGGEDALFVNDYVSFYPSANLSYTVDDRNQWVLSYNRRVNRPRGRQVNPFVDNADPRNLRYGNPFLRPEYTDGLEFGHQLTTKAVTLTTSLFYKTTRDVIRRYIEVAETGVAYRTYVNLARQSNSGLEVVAMWRKGRTLQVRLNGSVYYQSTDGSNLAPDLGNNGFQGNAGYQVSALVKGDWKVQVDGRYRAPAEYPQGTFAGYVSHSAAVNRDFYDGKLRASVRVSDIFDQRQWSYTSEGSDFFQDGTFKRQSRFVYASLTWSWGKLEPGQKRGRGGYDRGSGGNFEGGEF
ncbi:MAG: TonB-dependent receptor domain-containing protein [Flavobacteriales bacterium]